MYIPGISGKQLAEHFTDDLTALRKRLAEIMGKRWPKGCNLPYADEELVDDVPNPWHPDEDIAQAFMVAEKIGLRLELTRFESGMWKCWIYKITAPPDIYPGHLVDTPALAICLAADQWLKGKGER